MLQKLEEQELGRVNEIRFGTNVVAYDKEKVREYLSEKIGNPITENYVDNLFRRKNFPCKRLGRKLYVEPDKLENFLVREKIINIPKAEEKNINF